METPNTIPPESHPLPAPDSLGSAFGLRPSPWPRLAPIIGDHLTRTERLRDAYAELRGLLLHRIAAMECGERAASAELRGAIDRTIGRVIQLDAENQSACSAWFAVYGELPRAARDRDDALLSEIICLLSDITALHRRCAQLQVATLFRRSVPKETPSPASS